MSAKLAGFFRDHGRISVFRSALFLASLMVILEHHHVLEWLDVSMLRIVATFAPRTAGTESVKALVFTIQEELFEKEFQSRTPIKRDVLLEHLRELDKVYGRELDPKTGKNVRKVLAIDYDLSPNSYDHKCEDGSPERDAQQALEEFLASLVNRDPKDGKINVVLIKHIPVKNPALCECKRRWEQKMSNQGIIFGHPDLVYLGLLGPVMKYTEYTAHKDSFPAAVRDAEKNKNVCDNPEFLPHKDLSHASFHPIDYVKGYANGAVKVCPLTNKKGFDDCKTDWRSLEIKLDKVSVIFFGGDYGKDDTYITPLGALPGVIIQAYTYFSMLEHGWWARWGGWLAWFADILLGFVVGLRFHRIWHKFHRSRHQDKFVPQVGWAALNFLILIGIFASLVWIIAFLLPHGIWINPALIVIGLFIHSYMAAATTTDTEKAHETETKASLLYVLLGIPSHGVLEQALLSSRAAVTTTGEEEADGGHTSASSTPPLRTLFGIPGHNVSDRDLLVYMTLKIAIFWIAIGLALYLLATHH
jgi:hypothetical protein